MTSGATSPVLEEIAASADEMLTLYELAQGLAGQVSLNEAGDLIAKHLRRLIPSSLTIFYIHDSSKAELEARHAIGENASTVVGIRIPIGQRLSGWVAANRQTIVNSDAVLDLGDAARSHALAVKSCLSTPLLSNDHLVGVLSLYSSEGSGFTEDHRRIAEAVASQIAHTFELALEFDVSIRKDELTGLPGVKQLERLFGGGRVDFARADCSLLLIDVVGLTKINETNGRAAGDDALRHVVSQAKAALRVGDLLFRSAGDEFVAYLSGTDPAAAESVAERIRTNIERFPVLTGTSALPIAATVTHLSPSSDRVSLRELLADARRGSQAESVGTRTGSIH
jgi:diguanylate cyclase (GGDEF)-like protein